MAASFLDWRALPAALALCVLSAAAQEVPILLDAATTDFDRGNQRLRFEEVSIRRGGLGIVADRADTSRLDFADSTWVFEGSVRIFGDNAEVMAQRAEMQFADHRLQRATITGAPAVLTRADGADLRVRAAEAVVLFDEEELSNIALRGAPAAFEHTTGQPQATITRGSAGRLAYDLGGKRITMTEDAWVSQGENEIRGAEITYDIAAQRIVAGGEQAGDRVRITITPPVEQPAPDGGTDDDPAG